MEWTLRHAHEQTKWAGADYPGWKFLLAIDGDDFMEPSDDEGITPKQAEAWQRDEWRYVTATVYAIANDIVLGSASYGGLEYGEFTDTDEKDNVLGHRHITIDDIDAFVGSELAGEAQSRALETIEQLMKLREEK